MTRPTWLTINTHALAHNARVLRRYVHNRKIMAMVKANAYGCGLSFVVPALRNSVDAFGVACLEEGLTVRTLAPDVPCYILEGFFIQEELILLSQMGFVCVLHQPCHIEILRKTPLPKPLKVWIKCDTGMHRLGFPPEDIADVMTSLKTCSWVQPEIGLMTHFASADLIDNASNALQQQQFATLVHQFPHCETSSCNSAASLRTDLCTGDIVRPGIALYGVSPFAEKTGHDFGLQTVMHLHAGIIAIHDYPADFPIGYGGTWKTSVPARIAVVACGYGDGYPRHITAGTSVWIQGETAPIVGRVSMDMITVDITRLQTAVTIGTSVELWGEHIPDEHVAEAAGTIPYELLCQVTSRPIRKTDQVP